MYAVEVTVYGLGAFTDSSPSLSSLPALMISDDPEHLNYVGKNTITMYDQHVPTD